MAMKCPVCGHIAHTRSSEYCSSKTKRSYLQCKNIYCSCTFSVLESVDYIIRRPMAELAIKMIENTNNHQTIKEISSSTKINDRCLGKYGSNNKLINRQSEK
ncbi:ogr/Delta-like zinc finger family protein [Proteus alimentorum]|uniref:Ogr/Delta-like zinc finger family protein n=1 Tax=Proteus alimentorum TaxID=1973495 RepID=A0ABS0IXG8_9GAMM|nr:ogr/Delta-like zinc finger family protein [Proteus alimentorum]MBG2743519.1 ogr/Delta-like zinc finger family protein [Proteus mirabilis]HEM7577977.1 ogr/Delta-like zinc finger family protein [Serratia marcescens]MBG2877230.1 ogr/Delta-like zinc finger family protein [Proteus alimentorum]MBG2880738.1 ogr/Delta-like zinc finger family protein [Proteus alimentorum]HEH1845034.1 ogr/Delta-like zinc finger family protein [Proteus mirabilis]